MTRQIARIFVFALLISALADDGAGSDRQLEFFESRIRPVLVTRCYKCHSDEAQKGGLRLDSRDAIHRGGDSGPAVIPGEVEGSLLLDAIRYESFEMPPDGKLSARVISDFARWIEEGAFDPRSEPTTASKEPAPASRPTGSGHWSLSPPEWPVVPNVVSHSWPHNPIDHFVLARLEQAGLHPTVDAPAELLCRRLYLTLIGLPPTLAESNYYLESIQQHGQTVATEQLVDRLLGSPHFGERWGRHWLDLARYADTNIGSSQRPWSNAWLFRNYVIKRFNEGIPFDRFVTEQIAGDLLPAGNDQQRSDHLVATGFLGLATRDLTERDAFQIQLDGIDDALDTIGKSLLGLSIGCARCHDHKFDPIPAADYYALAGILKSSWLTGIRSRTATFNGDEFTKFHTTTPRSKLPGSQLRATTVTEFPKRTDLNRIQDMSVHLAGSYRRLGSVVPRGFIKSLGVSDTDPIPTDESGRRQLAQWLTSRQNPLTARVMANRIWFWLMGRPLVESMDNFGATGRRPTHPELLDWLALQFRDRHNWHVKPLIREIVLSRTWQLSTTTPAGQSTVDPANQLYSRKTRVRLEAEQIHDSLLALANRLDRRPVESTLPEFEQENTTNTSTVPIAAEVRQHRAVYLPIFRKDMPNDLDVLKLFNLPDPKFTRGQRESNTLPAQALFLWNSPLAHQAAADVAEQLLSDRSRSETAYAEHLIRVIYGRQPDEATIGRLLKMKNEFFTAYQRLNLEDSRRRAWQRVIHTMLMSNEFIFIG